MHELAARTSPTRPAHPGEHDFGGESGDGAREERARPEVEPDAQWPLLHIETAAHEALRPGGIAPDHEALRLAGEVERDGETLEECLRAAMCLPRHRLKQAGHAA